MQKETFYNYLNHPEKLNEDSLPELKKLVEGYPTFQAAWILLLKNLKMLDHPEFDSYLQKGAIRIGDRRKLYHFLHREEMAAGALPDVLADEDPLVKEYMTPGFYQLSERKEDREESLIDLIRSIRKKEAKKVLDEVEAPVKHEPEEKADHSLVTETLAKIYAQQKHYQKAIEAYKNLSLKFPEKSTYFAGQIEKLKKLMN